MSMGHSIVSIASIHAQAQEAARQYDNLNDACPYPFSTQASRLFAEYFASARAQVLLARSAELLKQVSV